MGTLFTKQVDQKAPSEDFTDRFESKKPKGSSVAH